MRSYSTLISYASRPLLMFSLLSSFQVSSSCPCNWHIEPCFSDIKSVFKIWVHEPYPSAAAIYRYGVMEVRRICLSRSTFFVSYSYHRVLSIISKFFNRMVLLLRQKCGILAFIVYPSGTLIWDDLGQYIHIQVYVQVPSSVLSPSKYLAFPSKAYIYICIEMGEIEPCCIWLHIYNFPYLMLPVYIFTAGRKTHVVQLSIFCTI